MNSSEPMKTANAQYISVDNSLAITRTPLYFDVASNDRKIFGWYHAKSSATVSKNCAAVICNPLGYEYTHSYRSLRHLADCLANAGVPTLRFDYSATGNSPDDDLAPERMTRWLEDIHAAIATARTLSGVNEICVLGIRMGATLGAVAASEQHVEHLVLWNPCNSGRQYVREMKALASAAADDSLNALGIESAGFILRHDTAEALKNINLLNLTYPTDCKILLIQRDDLTVDTALENYLHTQDVEVAQSAQPGFTDMMAEPQFTAIPTAAIQYIVDWLSTPRATSSTSQPNARLTLSETIAIHDGVDINERICQFGPNNQLFGMLSTPAVTNIVSDKPAIVFLNSGSVHQVGPNRLYVTLARKLSTLGHVCLRFDLQGLGDSLLRTRGTINHPYPPSATEDTAAALEYLQAQTGTSKFILVGLCSGAHNSFHAALELPQYDIAEIILINPLTFQYVEGMSLETTQHFLDVAYYKKSARNISSWIKLLRGKVNVVNLANIAASQVKVVLESFNQYVQESVFDRPTTQLSTHLRSLFARKIPLTLFVAANDPGFAILTLGAQFMTKIGMKSGMIQVQFIPDADHTFSRANPRRDVISRVYNYLAKRYSQANVRPQPLSVNS